MTLNINDISGKHEHRATRKLAYKNADLIILCYSLADKGVSA